MRSMYADAEYFAFLDGLRVKGEMNTVMVPAALMNKFPDLRAEEAKVVCADWRAAYYERHSRIVRR